MEAPMIKVHVMRVKRPMLSCMGFSVGRLTVDREFDAEGAGHVELLDHEEGVGPEVFIGKAVVGGEIADAVVVDVLQDGLVFEDEIAAFDGHDFCDVTDFVDVEKLEIQGEVFSVWTSSTSRMVPE